jgi:sec-independent protein translocase protein TatC
MTGIKEEKRVDLLDHLAELRTRVVRALFEVVLGMALVWIFYEPIYAFLMRPVLEQLAKFGGDLNVFNILEGFMVRVKISLIGGLILSSPAICYEVWAFISPGLTRRERGAVAPIAPVAAVLFLMGVGMAYVITKPTVAWLLHFIPKGAHARLNLNDNLLLILKFYLAFGLAFQLPIVIILLAKLGLVNARLLTRRWREATVVIFTIAAIVTPTWDPVTMTICAIPLVLLYFATTFVVGIIDRRRARAQKQEPPLAG